MKLKKSFSSWKIGWPLTIIFFFLLNLLLKVVIKAKVPYGNTLIESVLAALMVGTIFFIVFKIMAAIMKSKR